MRIFKISKFTINHFIINLVIKHFFIIKMINSSFATNSSNENITIDYFTD